MSDVGECNVGVLCTYDDINLRRCWACGSSIKDELRGMQGALEEK